MKKTYFKKSVSLIMTVLMLMSCWVFVAPAHAADATVNPTALTAIYNGSGDRGDASRIVICSDGEAGNTTVGHIRFNISSFDIAVGSATLTLSTGNHGGTLVSNCRVDVYPLAVNQCQATSGTYLVNNIANVYGSTYNSASGVSNALGYYGLTTADKLGTVYQDPPGTHTIDVTSAVQKAKSAGNTEVCFLFLMPEIFNDGNGDSWSDTHINVSGTSLSYTKATNVASNTGAPIVDINTDAANTVIGLNTAVNTVYGSFESDADYTNTEHYDAIYHNVLYTDGAVTSSASATSAKTEYGSSWTGSNGVTVYWYHPTATLLYDGDTTNLPRLGVVVNTVMYYTGTWSRKTVNRLSYVASGGNGFNFTQNWHGSDGRLNFQYMWHGQSELMGYTSTVENDDMKQTLSGNSDNHMYANLLKFTDTMESTEYYRSAQPTFGFYGDNGDDGKTITATTSDTLYIINYVPLRTAIEDAMTKLQDIKTYPGKYTTASVAKFVAAANALVAAKPNNYIHSALNDVTGWASAAEKAVNAYNEVKLELATYDVTYENLFSLSSWLNSASGVLGTSAKGTMTCDVNAGTITFANDASNTQSYPNDHYSAHGFANNHYNVTLVPGETYTFEYKTSGGTGDQVHIFFYDSSGNAIANPANRGNPFANAYGSGNGKSTVSFTAPENATKASIRFGSTVLGETVTFSDIVLYSHTRGDAVDIANWNTNPIRKVYTYNTALGTKLDVPVRTGYTFNGWWVDSVNVNGIKDEGEQVTDGNGNVVSSLQNFGVSQHWNLYSEWTINQYTVKFVNAKGLTVSESKYDYGMAASSIVVPANSANDYDDSKHYSYSWPTISDLGAADVTYTEIPFGTDHSYTYTDKDDNNHIAACACGYSKEEAHSYDGGVINPAPSCTVDGVKTYTCSLCSGTKTEAVNAKGHTEVEIPAVDATCTTPGKTAGKKCSVCGAITVAQTEISATGHSWSDATCTAPKTCSVCDATEGEALGHNYTSEVTTPATCTQPGVKTYTCSTCGDSYTEEIEATGHSYTSKVTAPTCTEQGYTTYTCACGDTYKDNYVDATGHQWSSWEQYQGTSKHRRTCSKCSAYEEGAHTYNSDRQPKTNSEYFHDYKCDLCDARGAKVNGVDTLNAGESCYADGVSYVDNKDGYHTATCVCGRTEKTAHWWTVTENVAATCTTGGHKTSECDYCDAEMTETFDPLGHLDENHDHVCERNCGVTQGECSDSAEDDDHVCDYGCGKVLEECLDAENDGNHKCDVCDKDDVTEHIKGEETKENITEATCGKDGKYDSVYYCTECNVELECTEDVVIPATGNHTEGEAVKESIVKATCTADGSYNEVVYCTVCDAQLSSETKTISAREHDYGEWYYASEENKPTYTAEGTQTRDCKNTTATELYEACSHSETQSVPMLVDDTAPTGTISIDTSTWDKFLETITFGIYTSKNVALTITATDDESGVDKIYYYISASAMTEDEVKAITTWEEYTGSVSIDKTDAETIVVYAKLVNTQNGVSYLSTDGVTFDKTAPVITTNINCTSATVTVEDANLDKVTVDGAEVEITDGAYTLNIVGTYEVVATDKAGNSTTETVEIKGHTPGAEANCTTAQTCTVCQEVLVEALGHNYTSEVTAPTCTEKGYTTYTCTRCDDSYVDNYVDAKGHTEGEVKIEKTVNATCTVDGSHEEAVYCTVCSAELSRKTVTDKAPGHTPGAAANCTTAQTCTVCQEVLVEALGHTPAEAVRENEVDSTCYAEGSYDSVVYCSVAECKAKLSSTPMTIEKKEHTPAEAVVENEVDSTCYAEGSYDEVVYCSVAECKEKLSSTPKTIEKKEHTPAEAVRENEVDSTCYAEGSYDSVVYCSVAECKAKLSSTPKTIEKKEHTPAEAVVENEVDSTCYAEGSYDEVVYCSVAECKEKLSSTPMTIEKKEHTPAEAIRENEVDSTCYAEGSYDEVVYCSVAECKEKLSSTPMTIEKKEHTPAEAVVENEVDSTCYAEGSYDEVVYCSVAECKEKLSSTPMTIEKKEHTPAEAIRENEVDSTCYAEGSYDSVVYCSVAECKAKLSSTPKTIEKKEHTPAEAVRENEVDSTCYAEGSYDEVVYCSVAECKAKLSSTPMTIEKKAHTPEAAVIENNVEPDCENDGSYDSVIYCSVCKAAGEPAELSRNKVTVEKTGHNYTSEVTKEPTCTEKGERTYTCQNDTTHTYTEDIAPLGHIDDNGDGRCDRCTTLICDHKDQGTHVTDKVDATCENDGYTGDIRCDKCNEIVQIGSTVNKLGHAFTEKVETVDPTCTADGYTTYKCSRCDATEDRDTVPAAHKLTKTEAKAETCDLPGNIEYWTCSACDKLYKDEAATQETTAADVVIPAKGHNYTAINTVAPTCTEKGYTSYKCDYCTSAYDSDFVDALGHSYDLTTGTNNNDGTHTVTCTRCAEGTDGHTAVVDCSYGEGVVTAPTCTKGGYTTHTCTVCGYSYTDATTQANGHSYGNWVSDGEGTDTHTKTCTVCTDEADRTVTEACADSDTDNDCLCDACAALVEHSYGDADCNNPATCTVCGATTGEALGHNYKSEETAPTCTEKGYTTYTCTRCDDSYVDNYVDAKGHDMQETAAEVKATCTSTGTTAVLACANGCGKTEGGEVIPEDATNHASEDTYTLNEKEATCYEEGYTGDIYYSCCNVLKTKGSAIEKIAHTPAEAVRENEVDSTCYAEGSYDEVVYCSVEACKHEISRTPMTIEKIAHTEGTAVEENRTESTCKVAGSYDSVVYCSVCDEKLSSETIALPLAAHTEGTAVIENKVDPGCENEGSYDTVVYCTVCNDVLSKETTTIDALGHKWVAADCESPRTCSVCGATDGEALGHTWVAATCTTPKTCSVCGNTEGTVGGHTVVTLPSKAPTCEEGGFSEGSYCSVCNEVFSAQIAFPATGHIEATRKENIVPSTCNKEGSYDLVTYCVTCDKVLSTEVKVIEKLDHTPMAETIVKEVLPTCKDAGYRIGVTNCSVCGEEIERRTIVLPALKHSPVESKYVAPTCEETGLTEGVYCEVCGTVITAQEVIPAKGHKKETITATIEAATCTKEGVREITVFCTVCNKILSVERQVIPVAEHTPADEIRENVTEATCGKNGKYTSIINCSVCGAEISNRVVVIPSTGEHEFTVEKNRVEPTCSENGYITYACEDCGTQEKTILYAPGHTDKNGDSVCDDCGYSFNNHCGCMCHKDNWFIRFIYKIVNFFWKIFKIHKECQCGSIHY